VTGKSIVAALAHRKHFPNPKEKRRAPYRLGPSRRFKKRCILRLIDSQKFYKIATIHRTQGISTTGFIRSRWLFNKEKMVKQIERQIRDLQRELAEIQKEQSSLRLQPCKGDAEIRAKEGKLEELDKRARSLKESIRELERKNQELMSKPFKKEGYESPFV